MSFVAVDTKIAGSDGKRQSHEEGVAIMNAIESTNAPVANLRDTKKEMAAAKRRHPAGKQAPAKAPAKKASDKASTKIRWTADGEKDAKGDCPATGTVGDREYKITK
jgi:hypothetical protein